MISIEKLCVSYGNEQPVLDHLDLKLESRYIHGIVGLNGSGKTTLLNTIFGLKKADAGSITNIESGHQVSKKEIAYLVTENFFYSNITGREYLGLYKNQGFDSDEWNALFDLPLDQVIDDYSTGMKKKLALMGVLKQDKPVMILDEPFNGLDIETCRIMRSIILRLKGRQKTILVTSHIIETLTNLCDQIHYLEGGQIRYSKSKDEFEAFEAHIYDAIEKKNERVLDSLMKGEEL